MPRDLGATRNYSQIFGDLSARGVEFFFPTFLYQQLPVAKSLGFERDFMPPCNRDGPAFAALRTSGLKLLVPASLLYAPDKPLPPRDHDPLAALLDCAGRDRVLGVLSYDEPAHTGVSSEAAAALYARIKDVSPDLPVFMVHAPLTSDTGAAAARAYLDAVRNISRHADYVGFDVYPVPEQIAKIVEPLTGKRIEDPAEAVRVYMDLARDLAPGKRYFAVLQNFSYADQFSELALRRYSSAQREMARPPNAAEMVAMADQAFADGAELVVWFGGAYTHSADDRQWRDTLDATEKLEMVR